MKFGRSYVPFSQANTKDILVFFLEILMLGWNVIGSEKFEAFFKRFQGCIALLKQVKGHFRARSTFKAN